MGTKSCVFPWISFRWVSIVKYISTLNYNKKCIQVIIKDQGEESKNFWSETVLCNMLYLYVYILYVPTENTDS